MNIQNIFYKVVCMLAMLIAWSPSTKADSFLYVPTATINAGSRETISVSLNNTDEITAMQFDVKLPAGVSVNTYVNDDDETVADIRLTERKKSKHQLSCKQQPDGAYRVVIISMSNQTFKDNDGPVVNISVTAASNVKSGQYDVRLSEIHLVPMIDGQRGERIDQSDCTGQINIVNSSQSSDVDVAMAVSAGQLTAGKDNQTISLSLSNSIEITALQFKIAFPAGMTVGEYVNEDDEKVPDVRLTSRKSSSHQLSCARGEDGAYTVVVLSMKNKPFSGNNGNIIDFNVNVPLTMQGNYDVKVSDIHLVPLVNQTPGVRIDLPPFTQTVTVENKGGGEPAGDMAFYTEQLTLAPGQTGELNIAMRNEKDVCSFQMNISLPEGISIVKEYNDDDEYTEAISLTDRKKSSHDLNFKQTADGGYFLISYSLTNTTYRGNDGSIVRIKVKADENMPEGDYGVVVYNGIMVTPDEERFEIPAYSGIIKVDINGAVDGVDTNENITVTTDETEIHISGLTGDETAAIYSPEGQMLDYAAAADSTMTFPRDGYAGKVVIVVIARGNRIMKATKIYL